MKGRRQRAWTVAKTWNKVVWEKQTEINFVDSSDQVLLKDSWSDYVVYE
jgi:hypothetical protein